MAETSESGSSLMESLDSPAKKCPSPRIRKVGSKGAKLVCFWAYSVYMSCAILASHGGFDNLKIIRTWACISAVTFAALFAPFLGLVASSYFGRYKVMYVSIWLLWCGNTAIAIILVMLGLYPRMHHSWIYPGELTAVVLYVSGFIAFVVNSIPFGLDQMPDASSEQITAFIHWYTWSSLAGTVTAQLLYTVLHCMYTSLSDTFIHVHELQGLSSTVTITLTLCTIYLLHHWLILESESRNPLKIIFKVLKFAAKHKVPVRRSAFTYWEPGIPPRIDLGKSKYGGPFTNEEVEDVKTSLRMLLVISSISVTLCSFTANSFSQKAFSIMLKIQERSCQWELTHLVRLIVSCLALSLPVYDTTIRPIIKKCFSSTMQRSGVAQGLNVCASIAVLVLSMIWYTSTSPDHCLLINGNDDFTQLSIDYRWITVPVQLAVDVFCFFFFTAMLDFVCAQAPYNLRGLLVGLLPSTVLLSGILGGAVFFTWTAAYKHQGSSGSLCGIWFYLFTTITAILGCVIWCIVAKWYKKRERDEPEMYHIFAENYYSR